MPKILIFDIETAPNLAYVWGKYEQDVIEFDKEWYMLCYAYKWLGKKTQVIGLPNFKNYNQDKENDYELVKSLWKLFNEADIIIAHNGNAFDIKKVNARFIYYKLPPPTPYKKVDTLSVARRYFNFNSNKLDDLGNYLKIGRKVSTGGFKLWLGCMNGDKKCWKKMMDYNKQDVDLLEKVYLAMLPYIEGHPNIALLNGEIIACPNCGSTNIHKRGFGITRVTKYQRWQCQDCGSWHNSPIKDDKQIR